MKKNINGLSNLVLTKKGDRMSSPDDWESKDLPDSAYVRPNQMKQSAKMTKTPDTTTTKGWRDAVIREYIRSYFAETLEEAAARLSVLNDIAEKNAMDLVPSQTYPINKANVDKWVYGQPTPLLGEVAKYVAERITHIPFFFFAEKLGHVLCDIRAKCQATTHRPVIPLVFMPRDKLRKSYLWAAMIACLFKSKECRITEWVRGIVYSYSEVLAIRDSKQEMRDTLFVLIRIDDGLYSGRQMDGELQARRAEFLFESVDETDQLKRFEFLSHGVVNAFAVPFTTQDGVDFIIKQCKKLQMNHYFPDARFVVRTLEKTKMEEFLKRAATEKEADAIVTYFGVKYDKDIATDRGAIYFDHKLPDSWSVITRILSDGRVIGSDEKLPFIVGCNGDSDRFDCPEPPYKKNAFLHWNGSDKYMMDMSIPTVLDDTDRIRGPLLQRHFSEVLEFVDEGFKITNGGN